MKYLSPYAALILLLVPTGCSAPSHQRVPFPAQDVTVTRDDLTRIYFVREGWVGFKEENVKIQDGETEIGTLTSATYLCWERPGGRTVGWAYYDNLGATRGEDQGVADLDCAAGRAYYFKVTVAREGGKPEVHPLDPEEGRRLVAQRKPAGKS